MTGQLAYAPDAESTIDLAARHLHAVALSIGRSRAAGLYRFGLVGNENRLPRLKSREAVLLFTARRPFASGRHLDAVFHFQHPKNLSAISTNASHITSTSGSASGFVEVEFGQWNAPPRRKFTVRTVEQWISNSFHHILFNLFKKVTKRTHAREKGVQLHCSTVQACFGPHP
jgi:hypothetical protein